jgi:high-affinity K+ transport system ATPase subunit B
MKTLLGRARAVAPLAFTGAALAQPSGHMMDRGMWTGDWMYGIGGTWVPVLLVVLIALVAWAVIRKRK